jgi:uncharacterized glyoxalase superfamily protein PhnB
MTFPIDRDLLLQAVGIAAQSRANGNHPFGALLADGAGITVPLEAAPWGATFGMLTDKFGVSWLVNIGPQ